MIKKQSDANGVESRMGHATLFLEYVVFAAPDMVSAWATDQPAPSSISIGDARGASGSLDPCSMLANLVRQRHACFLLLSRLPGVAGPGTSSAQSLAVTRRCCYGANNMAQHGLVVALDPPKSSKGPLS